MNNKPAKNEIKGQVEFWYQSALDNLKTAEALLHSKRYNFTMFMCQQTIEALLKAIFVKLKNNRPPFIHKLSRLLVLAEIDVPLWVDKIILKVDAHYIKARYFNDRFNHNVYNLKNARSLFNDTKKVLKWLKEEYQLGK